MTEPQLRWDEQPLRWDDQLYGGAWLAKGRKAVAWALQAPELSADRTAGWVRKAGAVRGQPSAFRAALAQAFIFMDGPTHLHLRAQAAGPFSAHEVLAKRELLLEWALGLARSLPAPGPLDLVAHYARALPLLVMQRWLGVEVSDSAELWRASRALALFLEQPSLHAEVAREAEQGLQWIADALGLGQPLSLPDTQRLMLFFAGLETTRHLLSTCLFKALTAQTAWRALTQEKAGQDLVHQVLREHPPLRITGRRVSRSHLAFGRRLRRGDLVVADLASARLPFGSGPHVCMGAALTRAETIAALLALRLARPGLRLVHPPGQTDWLAGPLYTGLTQLWAEDAPGGLPCSSS